MHPHHPLLQLRLCVDYPGRTRALDNIELSIEHGEIVGLVGESGSGKSTLAMAIPRLLEYKAGKAQGEIVFCGRDLMRLCQRSMRALRGREISLILQNPISSLNPVMSVGKQIVESWRAHRNSTTVAAPDLFALLESVNLPREPRLLRCYPHQLSVGQAQRILIAMALVHRPLLLIADEPTSALDPLTQCEILKLLKRVNTEIGTAILYISHDLPSVASLCQRIAILQGGRILELNEAEAIFRKPEHPYTRALISAIPRLAFELDNRADEPRPLVEASVHLGNSVSVRPRPS